MSTITTDSQWYQLVKYDGSVVGLGNGAQVQYIGAFYENVPDDSPNHYGYTLTQIPFIGEISHTRLQQLRVNDVLQSVHTGVYITPICVFKDEQWQRIVNYTEFDHLPFYPHLLVLSCYKRLNNPRAMFNMDTVVQSTIDVMSITSTIELPIIIPK